MRPFTDGVCFAAGYGFYRLKGRLVFTWKVLASGEKLRGLTNFPVMKKQNQRDRNGGHPHHNQAAQAEHADMIEARGEGKDEQRGDEKPNLRIPHDRFFALLRTMASGRLVVAR